MEFDNPWKELAVDGLTRPDQVEDYKDWLATRQATLDQLKMRWEESYVWHRPETNLFRLDQMISAQFRIDIDRYTLDQFIAREEDKADDSRENLGI